MTRRRLEVRKRRGAAVLETAVVLPALLLLLLGSMVVGLGMFRRNQMAHLAYEGARWASVRGGAFQAASGTSGTTGAQVLEYLRPKAVGLDPDALTCEFTTVSTATTPPGQAVSVRLRYEWVPESFPWAPEALRAPITFDVSATMPVTY